ncbi:MAG: hypothetical protein ABMB14_09825 [Myxococcota bacterium]
MSTAELVSVDDLRDLLRISGATLSSFRFQIPSAVLEELQQEAVFRVLHAEAVRTAPGLVRRIARNLAIDFLRRRREVPLDLDGPEDRPWFRPLDQILDARRVFDAVAAAPAPYREVLHALLVDELDLDDLVELEVTRRGLAPDDHAGRATARDALYKRRARAMAWVRRALGPQ